MSPQMGQSIFLIERVEAKNRQKKKRQKMGILSWIVFRKTNISFGCTNGISYPHWKAITNYDLCSLKVRLQYDENATNSH